MDNKTILVVDDELVGRQLLNAVLISDGYNVLLAENGHEAIELTKEHVPDLILMDVMMPDIDGFSTIQKIKEIGSLSHIPIILVTALDDRDNRIKGLEIGATDYITKPFDRVEVLAKVKNLAKKPTDSVEKKPTVNGTKDASGKLEILIHEIIDPLQDIELSVFHTKIISAEKIDNFIGKYFIPHPNGSTYFLFGSGSPSEEDRFQLAVMKTLLDRYKSENIDPDQISIKIGENLNTNSFFDQKRWWLIHIYSDYNGRTMVSGFNQETICFPVGISASGHKTENYSFTLAEGKLFDITDMNYIIFSSNEISDITNNDTKYKEILQLIVGKQDEDFNKTIKNLISQESDNKTFVLGVQL